MDYDDYGGLKEAHVKRYQTPFPMPGTGGAMQQSGVVKNSRRLRQKPQRTNRMSYSKFCSGR